MKRHIQKTGVRRFFGQDMVDLQAEPLAVLDGFFAEYGPCVIEGCAITPADGGTFTVAPGLVALEATDPDSGVVAVRTMPFAGAQGVALPLYLAARWQVVERVYDDGKVKPIAYDLTAVASGVAPSEPHLTLTAAGGNRFVDAVQDGAHRFVSDVERSKWNDILRQAKEYATTQAEAAKSTAVGLAKGYTDQTAAAVRNELALGDEQAVNVAKAYADRIVAALVDNSPELLNTLEELAGALGNDPNFATTVMTEIGKRATTTQVNTALAAKANTNHGHQAVPQLEWHKTDGSGIEPNCGLVAKRANPLDGSTRLYLLEAGRNWHDLVWVYGADRVPWSGVSDKPNATTTQAGLMSPEDKQALGEKLPFKTVAGGDLNTFVSPCSYVAFGGAITNGPPAHNNELRLMVLGGGGGPRVVQLANGGVDQELYFRTKYDWLNWSPWHKLLHSGNYPKIIRGSVRADGYSTQHNAFIIAPDGQGIVKVTHNIGHTNYTAVATAYPGGDASRRDNVVTVWIKTDNAVWFVVTDGQGNTNEPTAFDFMIMPL